MTSVVYEINLKDLVPGIIAKKDSVFDSSVGKISNIHNKLNF